MNATGIQNPSQSVHRIASALVGIAAVMVLIVTVLNDRAGGRRRGDDRPGVEGTGRGIQVEAPANDFVLHGRGLVDAGPDGRQGSRGRDEGDRERDVRRRRGIVPKTACPERLA